jgi:hypothetical protein
MHVPPAASCWLGGHSAEPGLAPQPPSSRHTVPEGQYPPLWQRTEGSVGGGGGAALRGRSKLPGIVPGGGVVIAGGGFAAAAGGSANGGCSETAGLPLQLTTGQTPLWHKRHLLAPALLIHNSNVP